MKKIIPIALILFILVWLLLPKSEPQELRQQTAIVIEKQQTSTPTKTNKVDLEERIRINNEYNEKLATRLANEESNQKNNEPDLDLITAFRDYKYFETCKYFFEIQTKNLDINPVGQFNQSYTNERRIVQEPTSQQLNYLKIHTEKCKNYYEEEAENFYVESRSLQRRYQRIEPKTDEEKLLKRAIDLHSEFNKVQSKLKQASKGGPKDRKLDSDYFFQISDLNKHIQKIRTQGQSNFSLNITIVEEESNQEIVSLKEQIKQIEKLIEENLFIDNELIEQFQNKKLTLFKNIEDFLKHNNSPDALLLLKGILITNKNDIRSDNDFVTQIKSKFKFYDSTYFDLLNKVVYPLIACYMSYPCDDTSQLTLNICLDYRNPDSSLACGKNLEDFYLNNYLSSNQAIDFNHYFNVTI